MVGEPARLLSDAAGTQVSGRSEFTAWSALPEGGILVLVNSTEDEAASLDLLFARLAPRMARSEVYVIAEPAWAPRLEALGFDHDHFLPAADAQGERLELNHFLESSAAGNWIREKVWAFCVGSAPHSLYNEEVKELFEQRLALYVGRRRLLAHTLPADYLYVFDLPMLMRRTVRQDQVDEYLANCRSMVSAVHRQWLAAGRPSRDESIDVSTVVGVLAEFLGAAVISFDELSPIPLKAADLTAGAISTVGYLQHVVRERDLSIAERERERAKLLAEFEAQVRLGESLQQEVDRRDAEIARRDELLSRQDAILQREIGRRDELLLEQEERVRRAEERFYKSLGQRARRLARKILSSRPRGPHP